MYAPPRAGGMLCSEVLSTYYYTILSDEMTSSALPDLLLPMPVPIPVSGGVGALPC